MMRLISRTCMTLFVYEKLRMVCSHCCIGNVTIRIVLPNSDVLALSNAYLKNMHLLPAKH